MCCLNKHKLHRGYRTCCLFCKHRNGIFGSIKRCPWRNRPRSNFQSTIYVQNTKDKINDSYMTGFWTIANGRVAFALCNRNIIEINLITTKILQLNHNTSLCYQMSTTNAQLFAWIIYNTTAMEFTPVWWTVNMIHAVFCPTAVCKHQTGIWLVIYSICRVQRFSEWN